MRVLAISLDASLVLRNASTAGDTLERHVRYAQALRRHAPNGELVLVVPVPGGVAREKVTQLADGALTIHAMPHPHRLLRAPALLGAVLRLLTSQRFDVITTQTPFDDGLLGVLAARSSGVPLEVQMHGSFLDEPNWLQLRPRLYPVLNQLGQWVARQAAAIRVVSQGERARLERHFPKLRGKVQALHPLVNIARFEKPLDDAEQRAVSERLTGFAGSASTRPLLLYVGRLSPEKNLPTLLKAWRELKRTHGHALLAIAGDGPDREKLQQLAATLDITASVLWLGEMALDQLRPWYAAARATVLPSFYEGFGKVIVEAYLMGTPVVATPFVSAPELLPSPELGTILRHFTDPPELARAFTRLCDSADTARSMGSLGKQHIRSYLLAGDAYFDRLIELWHQAARAGR